jgi:hypothetical protein
MEYMFYTDGKVVRRLCHFIRGVELGSYQRIYRNAIVGKVFLGYVFNNSRIITVVEKDQEKLCFSLSEADYIAKRSEIEFLMYQQLEEKILSPCDGCDFLKACRVGNRACRDFRTYYATGVIKDSGDRRFPTTAIYKQIFNNPK